MIAHDREAAQHFAQNSLTYDARVDDGLKVMAKSCGCSTNTEVHRLRRMRELLGGSYRCPSAEEIKRNQGNVPLPVIFEFMYSVSEGKARGFGYRSVGNKSPQMSRRQWLGTMLQGAAILLLESNGRRSDMPVLGELTQLCYPRPEELEAYEQNAPMLLVGLVPKRNRARLQVFFNPRMGDPQGHDRQLDAMLHAAGCGPRDFARRLYDNVYIDGISLYGVGVEFDAIAPTRALIYLLFDRQQVPQIINGLQRLLAHPSGAGTVEIERAHQSLEAALAGIGSKRVQERLELAIVLQQNQEPQLKYSVMLTGRDTMASLTRLAHQQHCAVHDVEDVVKAVSRRVDKSIVMSESVHAAALQLVPDQPARIDLTLNIPL